MLLLAQRLKLKPPMLSSGKALQEVLQMASLLSLLPALLLLLDKTPLQALKRPAHSFLSAAAGPSPCCPSSTPMRKRSCSCLVKHACDFLFGPYNWQ